MHKNTQNDRLTLLEHTVVSQNSSVDSRLSGIESGIKELHDKMDNYILKNSIEMAHISTKTEEADKKIGGLEKRHSTLINTLMTVAVAAIASIVSFFSGK